MAKKNSPPIPPAVATEETPRPPLWETLAMIAAFVLLWFWFGAHRSAQQAGSKLSIEWTVALLAALAVMAIITVRRVVRFKRALEETQQQARRGPAMPWMPTDRNGRN